MARTLRDVMKRLRVNKQMLAERSGVSLRTVTRWTSGVREPDLAQLKAVVASLYALDPKSAEEVASVKRHTLISLGVVEPPSPTPELSPLAIAAVDAAVYSAAQALDTSPRALRSALLAALKRMLLLGVTVDLAVRALELPDPATPPG